MHLPPLPCGQVGEAAPGFAGLKRALLGILLLGVFGDGVEKQAAEPGLDQEGGNVERIFLGGVEGFGVVEACHERQGADRGRFLRVHRCDGA